MTGAALGNQITVMVGRLPTYAADPVERLRIVSESMRGLKESKQALGAEVIVSIEQFAPPTIFARASRLHFSTRAYNLLTTNVPGPQFPLYIQGREMLELIPVAFLAPDQRLAIACMSYNGTVALSLMGDYDGVPDLEDLADYVIEEVAALRELAGLRDRWRRPPEAHQQTRRERLALLQGRGRGLRVHRTAVRGPGGGR